MARRQVERLEDTPVLTFRHDTLYEVRKAYELHQDGRMAESIDRLQEWVQAQPHFRKKDFSRDYLERFIINCKGSVEAAKRALENICTIKTFATKFFTTDVRPDNFPEIKKWLTACLLPKTTKDHQSIYMLENRLSEYSLTGLRNYLIHSQHKLEYILKHNYSKGVISILDCRLANMTAMMGTLANPDSKDGFMLLTKGYSFRLMGLHIMSSSKLVNAFVRTLGQVMNPKLFGRIHVHKNLDTLYDYVDKDLLPAEYGGQERPFAELAAEWDKELSTDEFRNYCNDMFAATIDTSKKPVEEIDQAYSGMAGTFRTLTID